jgi:uncharacterized protein (DUF169 family)
MLNISFDIWGLSVPQVYFSDEASIMNENIFRREIGLMTTIKEFNAFGEYLENSLLLRTSPLAVKMLRNEEDIPAGAIRPKKDRGYHLAQCQAFSMSRRNGVPVAMMKEDNWCWGTLLAYGLIDPEIAAGYMELQNDMKYIPRLEYGKYTGIVSAPLKTANFDPDIIIIYSNTAQLRQMLYALSFKGEGFIDSPLYPVASCAFSVVPSLMGKYYVTLPDPGEFGRALAGEDEIIFSVPKEKVEGFIAELKKLDDRKMGHRNNAFLEMRVDFPRPDFYKRLYREVGLDADDTLKWPES